MAETNLQEFAVTELAQAPVGSRVVVADINWIGLNSASIQTVAKHTPGGRIVLENGAAYFKRSGHFWGYGSANGQLYRADELMLEAARAVIERQEQEERDSKMQRAAYNRLRNASYTLGTANANPADYKAARALHEIAMAWPLPQDIAGKLAEIAAELAARQSALARHRGETP